MDANTVDIQVQLSGEFVKTISVRDDASRGVIETAALKAAGKTSLSHRVTIVPGRLANVVPQQ